MGKHRLLIVEDDSNIAALVSEVARESGFEVKVSLSTDVDKLYDTFEPDVVVLDILMPEVDGFDVLNLLIGRKSAAQIVLLSGSHSYRDMAEKIANARGLRIAASLSKPFRVPALRLALQELRYALSPATLQNIESTV